MEPVDPDDVVGADRGADHTTAIDDADTARVRSMVGIDARVVGVVGTQKKALGAKPMGPNGSVRLKFEVVGSRWKRGSLKF